MLSDYGCVYKKRDSPYTHNVRAQSGDCWDTFSDVTTKKGGVYSASIQAGDQFICICIRHKVACGGVLGRVLPLFGEASDLLYNALNVLYGT